MKYTSETEPTKFEMIAYPFAALPTRTIAAAGMDYSTKESGSVALEKEPPASKANGGVNDQLVIYQGHHLRRWAPAMTHPARESWCIRVMKRSP